MLAVHCDEMLWEGTKHREPASKHKTQTQEASMMDLLSTQVA